tara:strand:+ start:42739 stop:44382 length:1644 start_codon:yes stop_codon:yes gene_type:complete
MLGFFHGQNSNKVFIEEQSGGGGGGGGGSSGHISQSYMTINGNVLTAYNGPTDITDIHIPENVYEIGFEVFNDKSHITYVRMPVTHTENDNFTLKSKAFRGTSIKSLGYEGNIILEEDYIFLSCSQLEYINLKNGTTRIGNGCFMGCINLKCFEIPETVTYIDNVAFAGCSNLEIIRFMGDSGNCTIPNNGVFHSGSTPLTSTGSNTHSYSGRPYLLLNHDDTSSRNSGDMCFDNNFQVIKMLPIPDGTKISYVTINDNGIDYDKSNIDGAPIGSSTVDRNNFPTDALSAHVISFGSGITHADRSYSGHPMHINILRGHIIRFGPSFVRMGPHAFQDIWNNYYFEIPPTLTQWVVWSLGTLGRHYLPYRYSPQSITSHAGGSNNVGTPTTYEYIYNENVYQDTWYGFRGFRLTLNTKEGYSQSPGANTIEELIIKSNSATGSQGFAFFPNPVGNAPNLRLVRIVNKLPNTWWHWGGTPKNDTLVSTKELTFSYTSNAYDTYTSRTDRGSNNRVNNRSIQDLTQLKSYLEDYTGIETNSIPVVYELIE